jgi:hypothetical protein
MAPRSKAGRVAADFTRWLPANGSWEHDQALHTTYRGLRSPDRNAGLLLAPPELKLTRGAISVTVQLQPDAKQSQARLLLGRDTREGSYITAGVGGHNARYVIEAWEPEQGYQRPIALTGAVPEEWEPNLRLKVSVQSRALMLEVNGVEVLPGEMPYRLRPAHQIGLFAWGEPPVRFEDLHVGRESPEAFVAIPFDGYDDLYERVIAPLDGLAAPVRGDTKRGPGRITEQIEHDIDDADLLIAEVSDLNPNVLFEAGYAMALKKPLVLLAKEGTELPFDVHAYRCVRYEPTPEGLEDAARELALEVKAALEQVRTRPGGAHAQ